MKVRFLAVLLVLLALMLALAGGASARTVPQGFYGVAYDGPFADQPFPSQRDQFDLMAASGVESVRLLFAWETMQPRRRMRPDFAAMDVKVYLATQRGIEILPQVLYPPYWARKYKRRTHSPPRRTLDYARFIRSAMRRYGPQRLVLAADPRASRPSDPPMAAVERAQPALLLGRAAQEQLRLATWLRQAACAAPTRSSSGRTRGRKPCSAGLTGIAWLELRRAYRHGKIRGHFNIGGAAGVPPVGEARGGGDPADAPGAPARPRRAPPDVRDRGRVPGLEGADQADQEPAAVHAQGNGQPALRSLRHARQAQAPVQASARVLVQLGDRATCAAAATSSSPACCAPATARRGRTSRRSTRSGPAPRPRRAA